MKRRLLPILMTLVLVCALPIWAAFVTSGDVTNPLVSTAGATLPDLQAKIDAAEDNATITLDSDTTITETLVITSKTLTLDLNGCTLRMTGTGSVLKVSGRATLTITDSSAAKSGTITGGNAEDGDGGGVYVEAYAALEMTGGCITGCHASRGGGGIYSSGDLYMGGTAKIEKCTGSNDAIWNNGGTIYADGGTVDGTVNNQGTITRGEGAVDVTVFKGAVYNQLKGTIAVGTYNGTVENTGSIIGGTFYDAVTNRKASLGFMTEFGTISGGTFYGPIVNEVGPGQVTDGTFAVRFDTDGGSEIEPTMVEHSHTVRPPSDPEKSGHTFTGWYLGGEKYNFDTPITAPLTLTAEWEKVPASSGGYYYYAPPAEQPIEAPKTADPGVALYGVLSLLSLTGLTCTAKKRH